MTLIINQTGTSERVLYNLNDVEKIVRLKERFAGVIAGYTCCYTNTNDIPEPGRRRILIAPMKKYLHEMRVYDELFREERSRLINLIRKINRASFEQNGNK